MRKVQILYDPRYNDASISGDTFFAAVTDGDLVKFSDKQVPDGIADEVEFEN